MAEYSCHSYLVGGLYTHGGDVEMHHDYPPLGTNKVWDREDQLWLRDPETGLWTAFGVADSLELEWEPLLEEFGPLNDDIPAGAN